jgi:hypothetical protein
MAFTKRVTQPDAATLDLIRKLPFDKAKTRVAIGYDAFDMDVESYCRKLMLEPTFNIAGFNSGYSGRVEDHYPSPSHAQGRFSAGWRPGSG